MMTKVGILLLLVLLIPLLDAKARETSGKKKKERRPINTEVPHNFVNVRKLLQCSVGLGTAGLQKSTQRVVQSALENGVTIIDSAQAKEWYNERGVGDAIKAYGDSKNISTNHIVVVTKIHPRDYELSKMKRALVKSKSDLQRSFLDIVLLHFPHCQPGQCSDKEPLISWQAAWKNLETLKNEMNIQEIGVSNFQRKELEELVLTITNSRVSVIQNWMDPFHQDREVREFAAHHGLDYMAYSSYGTQWGRKYDHNVVFNNPLLKELAKIYKTTIAQIVLSWLHKSNVVSLPRSSNEEHLKENFSYLRPAPPQNGVPLSACEFQHLPLTKKDMDKIASLEGILGTPWD